MSDIHRFIKMLQDNDHNKRYEACEELRVSNSPLPQEALDALVIAKNDINPDVADAARRALEFHIPTQTKSQSDKQQSQEKNNTNSGLKFTGGYLIFLILILLICGVTQGGNGLGLILAFAGGPLFIIALAIGVIGFWISSSRGNNKPQNLINKISNTQPDRENTLGKFAEKIEFSKLNENPDIYYQTGIAFVKKEQYDDAIIEFIKVIHTTSLGENLFISAQKELESLGFSKKDIEGIQKAKTT